MKRIPLESRPTVENFEGAVFSAGQYFALLKSDPKNLRLVEVVEERSENNVSHKVLSIGTEKESSVEDWEFWYRLSNVGEMKLWTVLYVRVDEKSELSVYSDKEIKRCLVKANSSEEALKTWNQSMAYYAFGMVVEGDLFAESPDGSPPMSFQSFARQKDK